MSLTTSITDLSVGSNSVIEGTQITFQAGDKITGAGSNNLLKLVDTGTTGWTLPAATVSGIQNITVQNNNTAAGGVTELGTVTAAAMSAGQTLTVAGQTLLATSALSASDVAAALAGTATSGAGFTLTGSLSGWTKAAGGAGTNSVVYTSTTPNAPVADLTIGGTAQTGAPQVNQITIATAAADNGTVTLSFAVNGVTLTTNALAGNSTKATQASAVASTINAYLGRAVATADGVDGVAIVSPTIINIGPFTTTATDGALTTAAVVTNVLAPRSQTVTISTDAAATTGTFTFNGVSYTTATAASADVTGAAAAFVAKINEVAGATIASNAAGVITINYGGQGAVITNFAYTGSTFAATNVVASAGIISASPSAVVSTQGAAAVGSTDTINADNFVGALNLGTSKSTNAVEITNMVQGQTATMDNGSGALTANYKSTATTGALSVTGGNTGGVATINGSAPMNSVTINSSGGAQASSAGNVNTLTSVTLPTTVTTLTINAATSLTTGGSAGTAMTATGLTTINASGAATTVNLGTLAASVTTVNGSGLTGGITATLTGAVTSFIGGAGVDTVTTGTTTATTAVINGGAGSGDILVLAANNDVTTSAKAAQYTNFEILRNGTTGSVDMSLFPTFTAVQRGSTGGFVNMSAGQAAAVTNRVDNNTASTFSLANSTGTSDVLSINLNNATTTTGPTTKADLRGVVINGFETMNVTSSSGSSASKSTLSFGNAGAADLTALNLLGARAIVVDTSNIAKAAAISASTMSYVGASDTDYTFAISGNLVKGSSVIGSNAADNITTSAAIAGSTGDFVTYNAGAGNDTISTTIAGVNNTSAANGSLKIDGGTGTDTLTFAETTDSTLVDANFQFITGIETIVLAGTSDAIVITTGGFFNTNFGGNTTTTLTLGEATNNDINTINTSTFNGNLTLTLNAASATTAAQTVTTGGGNDNITITATAYTGANNGIKVVAGAGNDTITIGNTVTTNVSNAINITGGLGADTISLGTAGAAAGANYVTIVVAAGDSTLTAYDNVSGFFMGAGTARRSDIIEFDGNATVQGNATATGVTGYTAEQLTYTVTSGVLSFAGTSAATLTVAQKASIAQTLFTTNLASVVFTQTTGAGTNSYVFNNNDLGDSLVELVGITATSLTATANTTTAGAVVIG